MTSLTTFLKKRSRRGPACLSGVCHAAEAESIVSGVGHASRAVGATSRGHDAVVVDGPPPRMTRYFLPKAISS